MASSIFYWLGGAISGSGSNIGIAGKVTSYNGVATAGNGVAAIVGYGRATAQVAANASVATVTVGASDGSFRVSANVLITTSTTYAFNVEVAYTDEGNTADVLVLDFASTGTQYVSIISAANGSGPRGGRPLHLRAKAGTTITIRTQAAGTYTAVAYNIEGVIEQIA